MERKGKSQTIAEKVDKILTDILNYCKCGNRLTSEERQLGWVCGECR